MPTSNYYGCPEHAERAGPAQRYPRNHVRYSRLLTPFELLNRAYLQFGGGPLAMREAFLREYDAATPFDHRLGSQQERSSYRATVDAFGKGLDENPHLSGIGRMLIKKMQTNLLMARRHTLEYYNANASFIEAHGRIKAPLIITGLPRTGSTLLQRLLAEDPNTRSPRTYEMEVPLPPLQTDADPLADPRIEANEALGNMVRRMAPGFFEKFDESHRMDPIAFEESFIYMLAHNGLSVMSFPQAGFDFIDTFVEPQGKQVALRYEHLFFRMLDAFRPASSHWTFKSPPYSPLFPLIFAEYPDARVVVTHRHPLVVLPSICRLMESWCIAMDRDGHFDKHRFGEYNEALWIHFANIPLQFRNAHPDRQRQIFDCLYEELFSDPIAMVKRIYAYFDLEVTPIFEEKMHAHLDNNRQGKYGRHRYSLEEYSIDPERCYEKLRSYMETYNFTLADARQARRRSIEVA